MHLKENPTLNLKLVDRNIDKQEEAIKDAIEDDLTIEYTNYAITINGENKVYLSSNEDAESIISEIKSEYDEKYTKDIGILQVYSENYEEIASVENVVAKEAISNEVKNIKTTAENAERTKKIKLASTKTTTTSSSKKVVSLKGINLSVRPVSGTITSRFGSRKSPGGIGSTNHKGLDIAAPCSTTISAAAAGTVIYSGYKGSLGNLVIIDHGNGIQTYYGHCSRLCVANGENVSAGAKIAEVGRTGSATGYHLHFEVHVDGTAVNPQNYIY